MKRILAAAIVAAACPAVAQTAILQSPAYKECSTLAASNPTKALVKADEWINIDNGLAAQHCRAMALFGLHRFDEAATALSDLHDSVAPENITLRSYLTRQAALASINATRTAEALALITTQIGEFSTIKTDNATIAKLTAELLLDRARIHITYGKLGDAMADLDHAVSLSPIHEEVLLERAAVFEKLGDPALARSDAEIVLKLNPRSTAAKALIARLSGPAKAK
ncbi:MAG: hypothetical protein V4735_07670 [Pseudomonadota bacterium]